MALIFLNVTAIWDTVKIKKIREKQFQTWILLF